MEPSPVRHRVFLVAAALLFSTGGAAIKWTAFSEWQVASFRSGVAAIALFVALPDTRRGWSWRLSPVVAAYAATLVLFVVATKLTTAANAIFLQSTAPLYILLLGPLVLGENVRRADVVSILIVAFGMGCVFVDAAPAVATAPNPARGNLVAAASGFTWACSVVGLRWLARHGAGDASVAAVAWGNAAACLATIAAVFPLPPRAHASDLVVIVYLGVVQIGLAYVFLTRAIRHVRALEAAIILLVEPVLNPVWTWLVHGERPGPFALVGGAAILLATVLSTWSHRPASREPARDRVC